MEQLVMSGNRERLTDRRPRIMILGRIQHVSVMKAQLSDIIIHRKCKQYTNVYVR